MSSFAEEIQQLQLRILELEKQQKEKDESEQKTSIDYNFKVIHDSLTKKKTLIEHRYKKQIRIERIEAHNPNSAFLKDMYDHDGITHLEAIYNILQIIDERLKKLER
jgi:hypothetical protein